MSYCDEYVDLLLHDTPTPSILVLAAHFTIICRIHCDIVELTLLSAEVSPGGFIGILSPSVFPYHDSPAPWQDRD